MMLGHFMIEVWIVQHGRIGSFLFFLNIYGVCSGVIAPYSRYTRKRHRGRPRQSPYGSQKPHVSLYIKRLQLLIDHCFAAIEVVLRTFPFRESSVGISDEPTTHRYGEE